MKTTRITASLAACIALLGGCAVLGEDVTGYYEGDSTFAYFDENDQRITDVERAQIFIVEDTEGELMMMFSDALSCPVPLSPEGDGKWEISNERCTLIVDGVDATRKGDGDIQITQGQAEMDVKMTFTTADGGDAVINSGTISFEGDRT